MGHGAGLDHFGDQAAAFANTPSLPRLGERNHLAGGDAQLHAVPGGR